VYHVSTTFVASGDVSDYDESRRAAIAQAIATAAAVPLSTVTIGVEASSVRITANISIGDETTAGLTASALSGGPDPPGADVHPIFASPSSLTSALVSAGVSVTSIPISPMARAVLLGCPSTVPATTVMCEVQIEDAGKVCTCRYKWSRYCSQPVGVKMVCDV